MGVDAKNLYKTLRKLKRSSILVDDLLKALINMPSVDAVRMIHASCDFEDLKILPFPVPNNVIFRQSYGATPMVLS